MTLVSFHVVPIHGSSIQQRWVGQVKDGLAGPRGEARCFWVSACGAFTGYLTDRSFATSEFHIRPVPDYWYAGVAQRSTGSIGPGDQTDGAAGTFKLKC